MANILNLVGNHPMPYVIDVEDLPPTYEEAIKVITNKNANVFYTDLIVGGYAVADLWGSNGVAAQGVLILHVSSPYIVQ